MITHPKAGELYSRSVRCYVGFGRLAYIIHDIDKTRGAEVEVVDAFTSLESSLATSSPAGCRPFAIFDIVVGQRKSCSLKTLLQAQVLLTKLPYLVGLLNRSVVVALLDDELTLLGMATGCTGRAWFDTVTLPSLSGLRSIGYQQSGTNLDFSLTTLCARQ